MPNLKLYFFPGTCARVQLIALEETNAPFETQLVVFPRGEHKQPDYLKLNPKGKVPTLLIDGQPLTETMAIIGYLGRVFPQAELMPNGGSPLEHALWWADLAWLNSTVHPLVTGIVLPQVYCGHPEGRKQTWLQVQQLIKPHLAIAEQRLSKQAWMLGERWSAVDAYLYWVWDQILLGGFDGSAYPRLADHALRSQARPAVQRALKREGEAFASMAKQGIQFDLPPPPK